MRIVELCRRLQTGIPMLVVSPETHPHPDGNQRQRVQNVSQIVQGATILATVPGLKVHADRLLNGR